MVVEIMAWVPADSLVKSKRVSKSWLALITELINDPAFVSIHRSYTRKRSSTFVSSHRCSHVGHSEINCDKYVISSVKILNTNPFIGQNIPYITEELNLPPAFLEAIGDRVNNACHCDGIVCLFENPRSIFMCNPILHEFRIVPEFGSDESLGFGFGYDHRAKDYKLVVIGRDGIQQSKVYSVNNDSWKVINVPDDKNINLNIHPRAVYFRGVCYWLGDWLGNDMVDYNSVILCFDMCDEEFHVVYIPEIVHNVGDHMDLTVWNDSLALYRYYYDYGSENIPCFLEIYELDNNFRKKKGDRSWIKQYFVVTVKRFAQPLSFIHNDEFLMLDRDNHLFSVNVVTQKIRDISVQDVDSWEAHWFCLYEKGLVSLKKR